MTSRVDAFLEVVRNPDGPSLTGSHPADGVLRAVLVQVIYANNEVSDEELLLGLRLFPELPQAEVQAELRRVRSQTVDGQTLRDAIPDLEDRRKLLQFAMHVATEDTSYDDSEAAVIAQLRSTLHPHP